MNKKILDTVWWTPPAPGLTVIAHAQSELKIPAIGVVAVESFAPTGQWKCYIGWGWGDSEKDDTQKIASDGMPLGNKNAACGFFPQLDPEKYSY